jgi:hypothetical protein
VTSALVGCGGSGGGKPPTDLEYVLIDIPDAAGKPETFKELFATGAEIPEADRQKYSEGFFEIVSQEMESDTSAKLRVRFVDTMTVETKGEYDWLVVKEGDKWKLKSAPLK